MSPAMNTKIVLEIAKLSLHIVKGISKDEAQAVAMLINHLTAVMAGQLTVSSFHDEISEAPQSIREHFYELLYEEK